MNPVCPICGSTLLRWAWWEQPNERVKYWYCLDCDKRNREPNIFVFANPDYKPIGKVLRNNSSIGNLCKERSEDAGLDIKSASNYTLLPSHRILVRTNLFIEIPEGHVGLIWSRSGLASKYGIQVGAGCIDSSYRGEVRVLLFNFSDNVFYIKTGDRIAQLLTIPVNLFPYQLVDSLSDTDRGEGGFGSTGT